uniref:Uncharacterized protein n=1 Tax=Vombatus ursinus TaxID=29139 RepID=A0A4X2K0R5_VOMUR
MKILLANASTLVSSPAEEIAKLKYLSLVSKMCTGTLDNYLGIINSIVPFGYGRTKKNGEKAYFTFLASLGRLSGQFCWCD